MTEAHVRKGAAPVTRRHCRGMLKFEAGPCGFRVGWGLRAAARCLPGPGLAGRMRQPGQWCVRISCSHFHLTAAYVGAWLPPTPSFSTTALGQAFALCQKCSLPWLWHRNKTLCTLDRST